MSTYSLMIHGGAGSFTGMKNMQDADAYFQAMGGILEQGRGVLAKGRSAVEAVETCCALLEDEPLFNAGKGSVLNHDGHVEMDASIMEGQRLAAGAVAALAQVANPVKVARLIMEHCDQVLLAGEGARRFAEQQGVPFRSEDDLITEARRQQWQKMKNTGAVALDHDDNHEEPGQTGTVGAVAKDTLGNLAAATSTGGMTNKPAGRIGDTPIPGAGVYADNQCCAVSATGHGEDIMRIMLAKTLADYMRIGAMGVVEATKAAMDDMVRRINGRGGVIVVDRSGRCFQDYSTRRMLWGKIEAGGDVEMGW